METYNITYEGVDYEVSGEWDPADETTGYKGGFSWMTIKINDMDVSNHIRQSVTETLTDIIVNG